MAALLEGQIGSRADDLQSVQRSLNYLSPARQIANLRQAYNTGVAVAPASEVAALIESAGFDPPTGFYQAGMIHGWLARLSTKHG